MVPIGLGSILVPGNGLEIDGDKIPISLPATGERVTYCKDPTSPMLVAADPMRGHLTPSRTAFLAEAWKVAYAAAPA